MESDDRASGGCGVDSFLLSQQGKKSRFKVLPCTATLRNRMPVFCRSATTPRAPARRPEASRRTTSKPTSDDGYVTDTALNDDIRHDTSIFNAVPENGEPENAALERHDSGPGASPGRTPAVFPQTPASSRQDPGRFPIFPDDAPTAPDCPRRCPTPRPFPTDCGKLRPAPTAATAPVSFLRTPRSPGPSPANDDAPDVRRPPGPLPRSPRPCSPRSCSPRPAAFLLPPLVSRQSPAHLRFSARKHGTGKNNTGPARKRRTGKKQRRSDRRRSQSDRQQGGTLKDEKQVRCRGERQPLMEKNIQHPAEKSCFKVLPRRARL